MRDNETPSLKETRRKEKATAEEAKRVIKEQARKKAFLAGEEATKEASKEKEAQRVIKRTNEETKQLSKDRTRNEASLAREQAIAEDQKARKLKTKS